MVAANWEAFARLPGSAEINFEKLARALIRRHYGAFGEFKELANQAGVEFHLKLHTPCELGEPGRWYGWQCKWYSITTGKAIGVTRRAKIVEGLDKSKKTLPHLTDWVLWTRHKLTRGDQDWFYALQPKYPSFRLSLKTSDDIEDLLVGPAAILRDAYFGELVLTPEELKLQHELAVAPVKRKFQAELHQVVAAETQLRKHLGGQEAWDALPRLAEVIRASSKEIDDDVPDLPLPLRSSACAFVSHAQETADTLEELYGALGVGDLDAIRQLLETGIPSPATHRKLLAKLRSARARAALTGANLLADLHAAGYEMQELRQSVAAGAVAVLAAAGYGKSELAINLTLPEGAFPGGVLFLGNALHAGQSLDQLTTRFKIAGAPVSSFERLLEAIDAAGQRAGRRIPIVIDGLNEAEDPRDWKDILAPAQILLKRVPYVLLVVTLRSEFAEESVPEEMERVELSGFEGSPGAISDYFAHYKIDALDADLPRELLEHPLTLRIFCEVTNPTRQQTVGVESLPGSLTTLFTRYFDAVAARVAGASPASNRVYREDVREALVLIGELIWKGNSRSIGFRELRTRLKDVGAWDVSMIRSLESEGILIRTQSEGLEQRISVVYDLMAGQLIAEHLLGHGDFEAWLKETTNATRLNPANHEGSHTLAHDTLSALVDLFPPCSQRRQLWQVAPPPLYLYLLCLSAQSDPANINRETVEQMSKQMLARVGFAQALFPRLRVTRAAIAHPFDALFLDNVLRSMTTAHRDLAWSEWLRENSEEVLRDLESLRIRWNEGVHDQREMFRARWVMWTLTSTDRYLRDVGTRALYTLALRLPAEYFNLMVDSLTAPDVYVSERVCAAGYGAALSAWSDGEPSPMRAALPVVARTLLAGMFVPSAPSATRHALLRQYCLGMIALARRVDPMCISQEEASLLVPPFSHLPCPFVEVPGITEKQIEQADSAAISMDFGNYTIGRLISGRSNYDDKHPDYVRTRHEIVRRMLQLGYDPQKHEAPDSKRESRSRSPGEKGKVDRYGKKYGWVAFFEMWGWRSDNNELPDWISDDRPSDADIDPSFPGSIASWNPVLPEIFSGSSKHIVEWIQKGAAPDYTPLLQLSGFEGHEGDWVMLDGFLDETAKNDYRNIFTFVRAVFVKRHDVDKLAENFGAMSYPGNSAIPDKPQHHYTYAGEMPFGRPPDFTILANSREDAIHKRVDISHPTVEDREVSVEIPVHEYVWESYHSELNTASGISLPSPGLCQYLGLTYRPGSWDLHDSKGVASLHRDVGADSTMLSGDVAFLRADLLRQYLDATDQVLVWMMWGERGRNYKGNSTGAPDLQGAFSDYKHIHKRWLVWNEAPDAIAMTKTAKRKPRTARNKTSV